MVLEHPLNLLHRHAGSAYVVIIGVTKRILSCFITIPSTSENIQMQMWIKGIALNIVHSLEKFLVWAASLPVFLQRSKSFVELWTRLVTLRHCETMFFHSVIFSHNFSRTTPFVRNQWLSNLLWWKIILM